MGTHSSNTIMKFVDNTAIISLITENHEFALREEVKALTSQAKDNNLHLNILKTRNMVLDFRRVQCTQSPRVPQGPHL